MKKLWTILGYCCLSWSVSVFAADMTVPANAIPGSKLSIATSGSGDATALVIGPSHIVSKKVVLGQPLDLSEDDLADAGRYILILEAGDANVSKSFVVLAGKVAHLSFVTHPSRAPVAQKSGINGTVYAFDAYNNLISTPMTVDFKLSGSKAGSIERQVASRNGIASISLDSPRLEGPLRFEAASGGVSATQVVRVVADEPCTLRIHAAPVSRGIRVETDPVKDCSGNPVPDGTLVTFTEWDAEGRSTVDASVKKGIATVELPAKGEVRISAASGVALGNEIRLRGAQ